MSNGSTTSGDRRHHARRPGHLGRKLLALTIAVIAALAGYGSYVYLSTRTSGATLVIYSYSSLLGGSSCNPTVSAQAFGPFEAAHGVHILLECPTGNLVSTLVQQKNAPGADLVIGLDEITATQAAEAGVLIPYASSQLANVPPLLVSEISPDHFVTPYEYGFLGIDYNATFFQTTHGSIAASAFPMFSTNASWARQLLIEDPIVDITGEEFLLWEIEFYTQVLHQSWQNWWMQVNPYLPPAAPDWSTAFGEFTQSSNNPLMVVSYSTDPAYAVANGAVGQYNSTVSTWNGTLFGWKTVYGIGVVNGTRHLGLDQEFIDWFLGGAVQSLLPTTEWEYPANSTIALPAVYANAIPPSEIRALNDGTTPGAVAASIPQWLNEWQTIING